MNKKERRQAQLERHYNALVRIAEACGIENADGKKISVKLLKLEREAHKAAENYCNGQDALGNRFEEKDFDTIVDPIKETVQKMFNGNLCGFFVNGDARGYALKIDPEVLGGKLLIDSSGIGRDWGGYGLLSPEITGN